MRVDQVDSVESVASDDQHLVPCPFLCAALRASLRAEEDARGVTQ
jgi:hypothetical protein